MHIPRHYRSNYNMDLLGEGRPGDDQQFTEWLKEVRAKRAQYQRAADDAGLDIPPQKPTSPLGYGIAVWTSVESMAQEFVTHQAYELDNGDIAALCFTYRLDPERAGRLGIWVPCRSWIDCPECHEIHDHAEASRRAIEPLRRRG